jgi:regulator of RNase E activity RraA
MLGSFSVFGMAKENKRRVTFDAPVTVNGTVVKAGNYEVVFADETGQLTIFKGKKQIAQAAARLEKIEKDNGQVYAISGTNEPKVLTSVTLKDGYRANLVNAGSMNTE